MNKVPEISCQVFIHNILIDRNEIGNYLLAEARIWYSRYSLIAFNCWENIQKLHNYLLGVFKGIMRSDPWLHRWLSLVLERAADTPVLEIGCGSGEDSETLVSTGLTLIAFDLSEQAIVVARKRVPAARFLCQDVREPFPLAQSSIGEVVASLSLHYFPWTETEALIHRVREVLRPGGLLLCRLNSTNDHNYGASGHAAIEANYYSVNGEPKRFFDKHAIDMFFREGWRTLSVEEQVTNKYSMPKALWEVILNVIDLSPINISLS